MMNNHIKNLELRAAKVAEEARSNKPRLVVGTEPAKRQELEIKPGKVSSKESARAALDNIRESLK